MDVGVINNNRAYDTGQDNNLRDRDTTLNNAWESQQSTEYTLKTHLEQEQEVARLEWENQSTSAPKQYGETTGDPTPDLFKYRGVQIRIKTQAESAIRQAGDQFLRFGYRYEGLWDITNLNVMPSFTYWEFEDLWFNSECDIMEAARKTIKQIFLDGTTVWSSPDKIGRISPYDNH